MEGVCFIEVKRFLVCFCDIGLFVVFLVILKSFEVVMVGWVLVNS